MARKKKPRGPTGLVWRGNRAWFDRRHHRFAGGRLAISLRTDDPDTAAARHGALNTLMERGDWGVLEAIRKGDFHISDAQRALREGDAKALRRLGSGSPLLGPAVERFLERKRATRSKGTVQVYSMRVAPFLRAKGDEFKMDEFTAKDAAKYLQEPKPKEPWAPATQEAVRVCLGSVWAMVMKEEAEELSRRNISPTIKANPWTALEMPKRWQTRSVFLHGDEWRDLDRSMVGHPYRALVACAFLAGLRQQEICHLRTGVDVVLDGDNPLIHVQARGGEYPWRPKTERGERDVPITPTLVHILREHIEIGFAGDRYLIHPPGVDRPASYWNATTWTETAYAEAGIKYGREGDGLTLHSGRHTYASWMAQDGVPLNVIAKLLGDTTEVVERTYLHLIPDTYRAAVGHIEARAKGTPETTAVPTTKRRR